MSSLCMFDMLPKVSQMSNLFQNLKRLIQKSLMNEYEKFCVDEAQYHLQRASELLTDGLQNPKKYYDERREFYAILAKMFPLMILMQQHSEPQPPDSDESESLSDSQHSDQSDEGSYVIDTPPRHSES